MNLRQRTLLHVGAVVLVLIAAFFAVLSHRITVSYTALETSNVRDKVGEVKAALLDSLESLRGAVRDWSFWDDAYAFAASGSPDFVRKNVTDSTFDDLQIDLIAVYALDGRRIFGRAADTGDGGPGPLPLEMEAHVGSGSPLLRRAGDREVRTGLFLMGKRPVLFASAPILRSDETGPARGTVIFARDFDRRQIARIEALTGLKLTVFPAVGSDLPADVRAARTEIPSGPTVVVRAGGEDLIFGYDTIADYRGRPGVILRAEMPRPIHRQGRTSRRTLLFALLACGAAFLVVNLVFLDVLILRRIARIDRTFEKVRQSGDTSARLRLSGRDELARMGASFDRLLETLEEFRRRDRELSITDPLTSAFNRRHFNDKLVEEIERSRRYGRTLSLIILDVDRFKDYNDGHGHPAGDALLKRTAELLRAMTRRQDVVTRFGGDEFAVLLPETPKEAARGLAERIRTKAAAAAPTLSVGVAAFPEDATDAEALLTKADGALYKAKQTGRNRVESA